MTRNLPIIGLVGGIGAGKSAVASALESHGCVVADADANIKVVLQEEDVLQELVRWWGDEVLDSGGSIDRKKVAKIVFENEVERKRLEAFLHPRVRLMQENQFSNANKSTIALVIDAPLLLEAGLDTMCDIVIFVDAPLEIRQKRVLETRGWDAKELDRREVAQLPLDTKRKRADYVVINAGELEQVHTQIKDILAKMQVRQFKTN